MDKVREWRDVAREARAADETVDVARIHEMCVEKSADLDESDPRKKIKSRNALLGNMAKDQNADNAIFSELSSSPAAMEATNANDAYGA